MDIFLIFISIIIFMGSLALLLESECKRFIVGIIIGLMILTWVIFATAFKEPIVSTHAIFDLSNDTSKSQYYNSNGHVVNITRITGEIYDVNTTNIQIQRYNGVWSLGIFCITGSTDYKPIPKNIERK